MALIRGPWASLGITSSANPGLTGVRLSASVVIVARSTIDKRGNYASTLPVALRVIVTLIVGNNRAGIAIP